MACILPVLMLLIVFIMRGLPKDYAYLVPLPYCAILMATFVSARLSSIVSIYLCFAASITEIPFSSSSIEPSFKVTLIIFTSKNANGIHVVCPLTTLLTVGLYFNLTSVKQA